MPAVPACPPHTAPIRDVYLPGDGPRSRRSKPDSQQAPKPRRQQTAPPPLTDEQAAWIRQTAWRPQHGRRLMQPRRIGQNSCLHLATPECDQCRAGYHGTCIGVSWPRLEEAWIADSRGSSLYWAGLPYRVWTPPRECACACRTAPAPAAPVPRREPAPPPPAPAAPVMPGGWEQSALPL